MDHFGHSGHDRHSGSMGEGGGSDWMRVFFVPAPMAIFGAIVAFMGVPRSMNTAANFLSCTGINPWWATKV